MPPATAGPHLFYQKLVLDHVSARLQNDGCIRLRCLDKSLEILYHAQAARAHTAKRRQIKAVGKSGHGKYEELGKGISWAAVDPAAGRLAIRAGLARRAG